MLKRNLLIIVAIGLGLLFSGNIIAQNGKAKTTKRKAKVGDRTEEVTFNYGKKPKANQRKSHSVKNPNNFQVDQKLGMPDYFKKSSPNQRKSGLSNKGKYAKSTNILPYMEQENLRKKGKYANQEVSYRKNKTVRRKNK
ncbi:MAG: hypothetical protein AAB336_07445 [Acidobacteriota bacterium]